MLYECMQKVNYTKEKNIYNVLSILNIFVI